MELRLSFREGQFSPAEALACTGLSLTLQRDWRSLGHLPPIPGGHARFSPFDLAMMRVMVRLRRRGLSPGESRGIAEQAARSVLYFALDDRKMGLTVEPNDERGTRYYEALSRSTDEGFREDMLDMPRGSSFRYILLPDEGDAQFLQSLDAISLDDVTEDFAYVSLSALSLKIVAAVKRPLFTLVTPGSFK